MFQHALKCAATPLGTMWMTLLCRDFLFPFYPRALNPVEGITGACPAVFQVFFVNHLNQILREGGSNLENGFWNKPECKNLVLEVFRESLELNILEDLETIKKSVEMIFETFFVGIKINIILIFRFELLQIQQASSLNSKNGYWIVFQEESLERHSLQVQCCHCTLLL